MKRFLLLALLLTVAGLQLFAQQGSGIDRFFEKYENDQSFTLISVTPKMFSMFSKLDIHSMEGKQFMQIVKKIRGLRILARENAKGGNALFKEASAMLNKEFEELMTVRDGKDDLRFLVKENAKGNIAELIMLVGSDAEFLAMSLIGDIDLNEISQLANSMNINGFDKLQHVKK
ncbi:DUF4252 domain-containing protein [Chitinophaga rhizophila]|uniref:DUF4252 domain-containing protein n=1 Tax=Chitinophaga rhizophila TaxID=2866212 RepID=A0ABS7GIW6_9BACT|nr:DUF4252 domain-containing protein [Chitinophaga rhizophila]MBW8687639.1 DUF4252 domain-containing protein [Chitinophaga rhizophila]